MLIFVPDDSVKKKNVVDIEKRLRVFDAEAEPTFK